MNSPRPELSSASPAREPKGTPLAPHLSPPLALERSRARARDHLVSLQNPDGHWRGELEGDGILQSEYVLTRWFLNGGPDPKCQKAAAWLRAHQLPSGGWAIYEGGPPDVSSSTKAYFVLKLLGDDPDSPPMTRARETILSLGGIEACNTFTQIYLAMFGQFPWKRCPAVPPEMVLLPRWSPFNLYGISAWSRTIVVPLSIIWAHKPVVAIPDRLGIPELAAGKRPKDHGVRKYSQSRIWTTFFTGVDKTLKLWEAFPTKPLRRRALQKCEQWIHERLQVSDGLGAIFPPIINTIVAFRCLGYPLDEPRLLRQVEELERLVVEEGDQLRVQPCLSPVWDTAIAANALLEAGESVDGEPLQNAARWLLDKEVRVPGDWSHRVRGVEPSGWFFEYENAPYPDCDDTAEVMMALARIPMSDSGWDEKRQDALRRSEAWLRAMQNSDGGWAAFDQNCDREVYTHVPFADHNAMLDPSCEDITARVLECFAYLGHDVHDPAIMKAIGWLLQRQDPAGPWFGRWGCNYIYGTWLVLWGLKAAGFDMTEPPVERARDWLLSVQNEDGGFGETPESYDDPSKKGQGPSTAAQTAWALLGLHAAGAAHTPAARRALEYLARTQQPDGAWCDTSWTGTGFPRVFYLRYHLYAVYFPLLALGVYLGEESASGFSGHPPE